MISDKLKCEEGSNHKLYAINGDQVRQINTIPRSRRKFYNKMVSTLIQIFLHDRQENLYNLECGLSTSGTYLKIYFRIDNPIDRIEN